MRTSLGQPSAVVVAHVVGLRAAGRRAAGLIVVAVLAIMSVAVAADAQPIARVRLTRRAPILNTPRPDGFVMGAIDAGVELDVFVHQGNWLQVGTPYGFSGPRGWVQMSAVELLTPLPGPPRGPQGQRHIRAFATVSPTFLTANHSFETVLLSDNALFFGAGCQFVWKNGAYVLGSYEQMSKTGTRVLVSGTQVYTLPIPDEVTVIPVTFTVGYRDYKTRFVAPYVGVGGGWHQLRENTPGQPVITEHHATAHIVGGAERALQSWIAIAGEIQWTTAPGILGHSGISSALAEDDLGGVTFRVKVVVGR